jgi:hypothetical protein
MSLKVIADYRELLIDIFFAIIITIGLEKFLYEFLFKIFFKDAHNLSPTDLPLLTNFDLPSLIHVFSVPQVLFGTFFFFAAFFWVIAHWVFYHELIKKYPYYNTWKFFVDIALFSIMFVAVNISYWAFDNKITPLFVLLATVWYFFACLWHVSDNKLRPIRRYVVPHMKRLAMYAALLVLLYDPLSVSQTIPNYRYGVMAAVIVLMIGCNTLRLIKYIYVDIREYNYDYIQGFPRLGSSRKKGKLVLKINPMKDGNKEKDTLTFIPEGDKKGKGILVENLIDTSIRKTKNETGVTDLVLEIKYKDENEKHLKFILNPKDQVVKHLQKTIKRLCENNNYEEADVVVPSPRGNITCPSIF